MTTSTGDAAPMPPTRQLHLHFLDGLRALAALYVVVHHIWLETRGVPYVETPLIDALTEPLVYGHYAVSLFIVISGFCLMLPVLSAGDRPPRWRTFFWRRARRILPPYMLTLVISLALIATLISQKTGALWDLSIPVTPAGLATHVLMIHDIWPETQYQINYPLWSIAVEWRIYLFFPLFLLGRKRLGLAITAILTTLVSLLLLKLPINLTAHYAALFVFGMLSAELAYSDAAGLIRLRRLVNPLVVGLFAAAWVVGLSGINIWNNLLLPVEHMDYIFGLWVACVLCALAQDRLAWLNRALSWRPLVFIGSFSYSIYLIHAPLLQVVWEYVVMPWQQARVDAFLTLWAISLPLVLISAYGLFLVAERPVVRRKPHANPPALHDPLAGAVDLQA
jgi:peptidoglycan/LPS O-acetylase OafA/YrhL